MKKIIFVLLVIVYSSMVSEVRLRNNLVELLLPYVEFNKELNSIAKNFFQDISQISKLREENYFLKNKDFLFVSKDFKEKLDQVNLIELDKIKKGVEIDDFFRDKKYDITQIIYLDKPNSKIYIKKVGEFDMGDSILIGRFYLGKIVSKSENLYEVELWNRRDSVLNVFITTQNSGNLVMNIRSENYNTSYIDNILSTEDVRVGDIITTASTNQDIPKDLFIGSVDRVEGISSQTFRKALIKKEYDLEKSNYVIILKND